MALPNLYASAILVSVLGYLAGPDVYRKISSVGVFRTPMSTPIAPEDLVVIGDTIGCEDLHYHAASNQIFTACESSNATRYSWFPPMENFDDPVLGLQSKGYLHVINAKV